MHSDFRSSFVASDKRPNDPARPVVGKKGVLYFVGFQADDYPYALPLK